MLDYISGLSLVDYVLYIKLFLITGVNILGYFIHVIVFAPVQALKKNNF